ncbi:hypothetical protein GCM10007415_25160 [Parapedobacter pyrenivorans]|uniref:cAMP-binding domain of CRP or a regulatory subunit of cAMP-dependent protein kinases n=1 Tax=Parapedobacter pyrenivorans TaxID=1305674 RepID=A0A917HUP6_9SPHI|nr:hypothetical protein [Parapedobacter pyrenivorans]GGG89841.1 hypothetical protein GCM10007415_25160 [Parapedobacter pyrenivorans]
MKPINMPEHYTAIHDTLLPFFDIPEERRAQVANELFPRARIYHTTRYQLLEDPGVAEDGQFMLVLQGLADSYYRCGFTGKLWGRHVYYRRDPIFAPESYCRGEARTDYIRALEPSTVLSISYTSLRALAERHSEVKAKLQLLRVRNTQHLLDYNLRNTLPADARIRAFLEKHPTLPHRTTASVCAMHNHMSRYWYSKTIKEMT